MVSLSHTVVVRPPQSHEGLQRLQTPALHHQPVGRLRDGEDVQEPEDWQAGEYEAGVTPVEAKVSGKDWKTDPHGHYDAGSAVDGGPEAGRGDLTEVGGH